MLAVSPLARKPLEAPTKSTDEVGINSSWKIEEDFNHDTIELEVRYCRKTRLVVKAFEKR